MRRLFLAALLGAAFLVFPAAAFASDGDADGDDAVAVAPSNWAICHDGILSDDIGQGCTNDAAYGWPYDAGAAPVTAPAYHAHRTYTPAAAPATPAPGGLVGCILERESNNGATSSNIAQFQESTWLAYGGGRYAASPGAASRADQIAMVNHVLAVGGASNWTQYDGC